MKKLPALLAIGLALLSAIVFAAGWYPVAPGEVVVVRRLGRLIEPPWNPGLHWRFPLGVDRLDRVAALAVRQFQLGQDGPADANREPSSGELLTGDLNFLRVQATVQYRVRDPANFVLRAERVEPILIRAAEAAIAAALSHRGVDAVLRVERQQVADLAQRDLQLAADRLALGVTILGVSLIDTRPPAEVAADFAAAQAAESERDRRTNDAWTYMEVQATTAASEGRAAIDAGRAAAERALVSARAEAQHFLALFAAAQRSRSLTVRRLYIESIQALLDRVKRKLILPPGESIDLTVLGLPDDAIAPVPSPRPPK
jgi:membrane protease subunit HflK